MAAVGVSECSEAFEAFVGVAYDDSILFITHEYPSESSWNLLDDRVISCYVHEEGMPLITRGLGGTRR